MSQPASLIFQVIEDSGDDGGIFNARNESDCTTALKLRPDIHKGLTLLVRQLAPGPEGLPFEIYCFTTTTVWADYERIQSDIFDHLMAIVPEFGLRLYQKPAGSDLSGLSVGGEHS